MDRQTGRHYDTMSSCLRSDPSSSQFSDDLFLHFVFIGLSSELRPYLNQSSKVQFLFCWHFEFVQRLWRRKCNAIFTASRWGVVCVYIMSHSLKCTVWTLREVALAASFGNRRPSESEPTYCVVTSDQLHTIRPWTIVSKLSIVRWDGQNIVV